MTTQRLGLIMNGVTGRMGLNQHLIRSIVAIREAGGVALSNGDRVMPDPILVGRDAGKVEALAKRFNVARWTTDLDKALADTDDTVFFDAATTQGTWDRAAFEAWLREENINSVDPVVVMEQMERLAAGR